jgi:hypothetical protein
VPLQTWPLIMDRMYSEQVQFRLSLTQHSTLASAVVIPDTNQPTLKRRQSDEPESETETKRARIAPENNETSIQIKDEALKSTQVSSNPRRPRKEEDRKRGQRLFGALLGTLSSAAGRSTKAAQQRADIEKRQAAKLRQLDEKVGIQHIEKPRKSINQRRKEQWDVDSAAVRSL